MKGIRLFIALFFTVSCVILPAHAAVPEITQNPTASPVALASSIDLSAMSFDELVALKEQINLAIWRCEEWQEVTVPQGFYVVGSDIPAGRWSIRPADGQWASIKWGDTLDDSGHDISLNSRIYVYEVLTSPSNHTYADVDRTEVDLIIKDGHYIIVDHGNVVFSPFTGKPDLGFK